MFSSSVTGIGDHAFGDYRKLTYLTIPANPADIGNKRGEVLQGVTTLESVTLVGCPLNDAAVRNVELALATDARVMSHALAGRRFGRFPILATPEGRCEPRPPDDGGVDESIGIAGSAAAARPRGAGDGAVEGRRDARRLSFCGIA
jgi:hypothetical protein